MADIVVRAPDGAIVEIPEEQYQDALNQGYTNVEQSEAESARDAAIATAGPDAAVSAGLLEAPEDYDSGLAAREKILSGFTFGQADELQTPESRARGRKFTEENPGESMLYEGVGQLPYAIAGAAGGAAAGAAVKGASLLARGAVAGGDIAANALVGGAQVEGEESRLSGEDFSFTDAAIVGTVGEVLGRGAAWGVARGVGGTRNLIARGERDAIAQDAAEGLTRGGWVRDYQTAQHAETYHSQLADLAARDLDTLESAFAEVSRQDRKRARIVRVVTDNPAAQREVNIAELAHLRALQTALGQELADVPAGPARNLARQLQERIDVLDSAPTGKRLWRALDENRQALQEYRQDLYQAYETNPGSAWLSREGLAAIDAAEKSTREALLREDVWGTAAAQAQREYNEPFHTKWFPSRKTVVGKLHFEQMRNAEGFAVYRGDPDAVRKFLGRDLAEPDGARLAEQFTEYLDGAEAIARAGAKDAPRASRDTLEAVRRLRKAQANAAQVTAAVQRTQRRTTGINQAAMAAGAVGGLAAAGPGGAALGALAARGARVGDWLSRAGTRLGWGAGAPLDMAALLGRDAIPEVADDAARVSARLTDDIIDGPFRPATPPPLPGGPPIRPDRTVDIDPLAELEAQPGIGPGGPAVPPPFRPASDLPPDPSAVDVAPAPRRVGVNVPPVPDARGVGPARRAAADRPAGMEAIQPTRQRDVGPDSRGYADTEPAPSDPPPSGAGGTPVDDLGPEVMDDVWTADTAARRGSPTRPTPERNEAIDWYGELVAPGRGARAAEARRLEAISAREFDDLVTRLRDVDARTPDGDSMADELEMSFASLLDEGLISESGTRASVRPEGLFAQLAQEHPEVGKIIEQTQSKVQAQQASVAAWYDELVEASDVTPKSAAASGEGIFAEKLGGQGGITPGGFFRGDDGVVRYAKFPLGDQAATELANTRVYADFGVPVVDLRGVKLTPEQAVKLGGHEGANLALVSEKLPDEWLPAGKMLKERPGDITPEAVDEYIEGVPADIVLGNWDIAHNGGNIMTTGTKVLRLDAGEAGANSLFNSGPKMLWTDFEAMTSKARQALVNKQADAGVAEAPHDMIALQFHTMQSAKRPLETGLARIEKVVADAGGIQPYVDSRFPHLDPGIRMTLAGQMDERLRFLKKNIDAIALLALMAGSAAVPSGDGEDAAAAGAMAPMALFGRRAALFKGVRSRVAAQAARRLFSATADAVPRVTARLVYSRAQIEERQREFQTWQANPAELVDRVAEGFRDVPPEHSGTVAGGVFRAASFLREKLPSVTRTNAVSVRQIPVSAEAMAKYARYEQAALDPRAAVQEAAESRHLSTELLETLQALYPDLLAELRVQAYMQVREAGPPATIQGRLNYAQLFDGDGTIADPAFSMDVAQMAAYAYEQAVPPTPGPTGGSPGVSRAATSVAAPGPLGRV